MGVNNYSEIQNTLYPASSSLPQPTLKSSSGILEAYGTVVPVDGTAGYVTGAIFKQTDGGANTSAYVNEGSVTSSDFNAVIADVPQAFGTTPGRGPSPEIWDDCPVLDYELNAQLGSHFFDDFIDGIDIALNQATAAASALGTTGLWTGCTAATTPTVSTLATDKHGVIKIFSSTIDQDAIVAYPKNAHTAGMFSFVAGKKLWMEARIAPVNVTVTKFGYFVGFAEEGLVATTTLIAAAGTMADKDYVGFHGLEGATTGVDTTFNTASGGASPQSNTDAVTTAAGTWIKIGIYFDGTTITFYADGAALGDTFSIGDTDFPSGEEMAFYMGIMNAHDDDASFNVDWVRLAQEY